MPRNSLKASRVLPQGASAATESFGACALLPGHSTRAAFLCRKKVARKPKCLWLTCPLRKLSGTEADIVESFVCSLVANRTDLTGTLLAMFARLPIWTRQAQSAPWPRVGDLR
jgi:hypothetical protein